MVTKLPFYPADHPVALALTGIVQAFRTGADIFQALTDRATSAGVAVGSDPFDAAAELVGVPYCRALDLYVDRPTKQRADALPFNEAHHALG